MTAPFTTAFQTSYDAALDAVTRLLTPDDAAGTEQLRQARKAPVSTRPVVAVVGEAKRGKSSLVNMLVRSADLSPVCVVETTAAPLSFTYGEAPSAQVHLTGAAEPFPVSVGDLTDWVTVAGAEKAARAPTQSVEVTVPVPLLQSLTLLDTPGLGGLASAVGRLTLRALESATVLMFVAEATTELTSVELEFLRVAAERVETVVIAVSGAGDVDREDLVLILEANRDRITKAVPRLAEVLLLPVDYPTAARALNGDAGRQANRWRSSGMAELEAELLRLTQHRGWSLHYLATLRLAASLLQRAAERLEARIAALEDPGRLDELVGQREQLAEQRRTLGRLARAEVTLAANKPPVGYRAVRGPWPARD